MKLCTVVWGRKTKIEFIGGQNPVMPSPILPQNRKNYNGTYGEICKKNLNCHNSSCTQDRVVIFGSRMGFTGTAYLTASSKFTHRYHRCHGNEIWDKNGYNSAYIRDIREIFVYNRGFSGSGYWMMPAKFYHNQPPLLWQRNLGQNRL